MLLRIVALGALGYAGYKYLSSERAEKPRQGAEPEVRLAGGSLSKDAFLVHPDAELLKP